MTRLVLRVTVSSVGILATYHLTDLSLPFIVVAWVVSLGLAELTDKLWNWESEAE